MVVEALHLGGMGSRTGGDAGPPATSRGMPALRLAAEAGRTTRHMQGLLARTIAQDVVPRLVLAERHRSVPVGAALAAADRAAADVAALVDVALARGLVETVAFVEQRRAGGLEIEALYLDLLTPAMRHLGVLWEEDLADFGQVTIATERLRQVMRTYSLANQTIQSRPHPTKRALLVPAPGDQHSFGLAMVAEFFGRAGWHLWAGVPSSTEQLIELVRGDWFAIVGFSVSTATRLDGLSEAIRKVRRLSRNRSIGVMVGGPVFLEHPEMVSLVGADATAGDGRQAVLQAHALLEFAQATC